MIRRLERRGIASVALVPLAALLLVACGDSEARRPAPGDGPAPIAVPAAVVTEQGVPTTLEVTGALVADARAEAAAEVDGRVVAVLVERGSVVDAGNPLARLDPTDARNQLREAEASAARTQARLGIEAGQAFDPRETAEARKARVTLERAEVEYRRYARLVDQGAVSRSEHDSRRTEFLAAQAQLDAVVNQERELYQTWEAQKARVAIARKALADTVVRAPWDGVVAEKHVDVGDYVKKGVPVATLMRIHPLRVELSVPEAVAGGVRKGQRVSFQVQTYPDRRFEGAIAYVGPALRADSRALVVEALVANRRGMLQPGHFATARIELPAGQPTPFVPAAAVRAEAGVPRLFVLRDGRAETRLVQLGREIDGQVEVLRGVSPGERVAIGALDRLRDGAPVTVEPAGGR